MDPFEPSCTTATGMPRAAKLGLGLGLGLLVVGAAYLYSVRGYAMLLDLSTGIAGLLCL